MSRWYPGKTVREVLGRSALGAEIMPQEAGRRLADAVERLENALKDEAKAQPFYEKLAEDLRAVGFGAQADKIVSIAADESHHYWVIKEVLREILGPYAKGRLG